MPPRWNRDLRLQPSRRWLLGSVLAVAAAALAACSGGSLTTFETQPAQPRESAATIGSGQVKAALILPLSGGGNAGLVAVSMRNAAELALSEFNAPNVQLLVKDDGGTARGAQAAAEQVLNEGAEIILGPLFAQSVAAVGQVTRTRNVPVIAFSTDASVASRGVYLLSFLPESDVTRVIDFAVQRGKRSFIALLPDNAYGNVVDAAFRQAVARHGGRVVALERYPAEGRGDDAVRRAALGAAQADSVFLPGEPQAVGPVADALATAVPNLKRLQFVGTGLWDDPRIYGNATLQEGWFAAPDPRGFKNFAARYRKRYGEDPLRTAALAYDAVALVAALVKTQGAQRFAEQTLTSPSGFSGLDGIFRFRPDGTNERGLAVMRVTPSGPQPVSPAPRAFAGQT